MKEASLNKLAGYLAAALWAAAMTAIQADWALGGRRA